MALGELEPGETLIDRNGPVTLLSTKTHSRPSPVYNLEIDRHHVYQVGHLAVLVHNSYPTDASKGGSFIDDLTPAEAARYEKYWQNYSPKQVTPGIRRLDFERISGRTGRCEMSRAIYDEHGRQIYRVDFSDHMRPLDHSNPHLHEYQSGPGFDPYRELLHNLNTWMEDKS